MTINLFTENNKLEVFIKTILSFNGDNNFLIINMKDDYYIQIVGLDDNELLCEAVSNEYIKKGIPLTENKLKLLNKLGWEDPDVEDMSNYYFYQSITDEQSIRKSIDTIIQTGIDVYDTQVSDMTFQINLE